MSTGRIFYAVALRDSVRAEMRQLILEAKAELAEHVTRLRRAEALAGREEVADGKSVEVSDPTGVVDRG